MFVNDIVLRLVFSILLNLFLLQALLLCFKLQESRIAVVSSTAAATLRQLVMFVVDKVVEEDRNDHVDPEFLSETTLPDGSTLSLAPSARDAFAVFEDLCLLANSEKPHFLKLDFLHKTFALELIESVLTNYHDLFRHVRSLFHAGITTKGLFSSSLCSIKSSFSFSDITYVPCS
jgi:hypothetical protein